MNNLVPIILFVYNRPWHTQQTVEALQKNDLASESELFIYADGEKIPGDKKVAEVRAYIKTITGFKTVTIIEREKNWGLADNIINGVTEIVNKYGKIIVLEDDIVASVGFLRYMNDALEMYEDEKNVYGITGFSYFPSNKLPQTFLMHIGCSWSWATFKTKWSVFEHNPEKLIKEISNKNLISKFNFGHYPFWQMLNSQANKKIDSWAIRFYASFFLKEGLFLHPNQSFVENVGFDNSGTHCGNDDTFKNSSTNNYTTLKKTQYNKKIESIVKYSFKKTYYKKKQNIVQKIKNKIKSILTKLFSIDTINRKLNKLERKNTQADKQIIDVKILNAKILTELYSKNKLNKNLHNFEFKVFSQWGDDGIIQFLINQIDIKNKYFIEFGVENYFEANTRYLLINNNWSGLVMDGDKSNIDFIKKDEIYWKYDLTAKQSFITAENINELIREEGVSGEIGLLHIDIDGNDYWIWKAINSIKPQIVIMEYNSIFGYEKAVTIPYTADFVRTKAHYSNLYAGASLKALNILAEEKGYSLIGSNSAGNNAYFVKNECLGELKKLSVKEAYIESKFREARNEKGELTFIKGKNRLKVIKSLDVFNIETNQLEKL